MDSNEWRSIESAPKDGTAILIARFYSGFGDQVEARVAYWDEEETHSVDPYRWHVEDAAKGFNHHKDWPTHWMPLPAPPV